MTSFRAHLKEHGLPLIMITLIILIGYFKVFTGASFLTTENNLATSNYTHGTTANGWRADKGMGLSFFFADVGMWHPWSPLAWWERIMPSRETAFNSSIVLLGIMAAFSQYFFIRKIIPDADRWLAVCVAPLIVFCADQDGYHNLRLSLSYLSGVPLCLMILWDQLQQPRLQHVLKLSLLLWFVPFFGNLWSLFQLLSLGVFLTALDVIYHRKKWLENFGRLAAAYGPAMIMVVLLGFWEIYSLFYERSAVGYMREKMTALSSVRLGPDLKATLEFLRGMFVMEWYPHNTRIIGLPTWPMVYQNYVHVVFPFVFLGYMFLKKKELGFWEFALKWLVLLYFIHMALARTNLIPGFGAVYSYINELSSKVITMYSNIYPLQVPLIALFLWRSLKHAPVIASRWGNILRKALSLLIAVPFIVLAVFSIIVILVPDQLNSWSNDLVQRFLPPVVKGIDRGILADVLRYNLWCWRQITHPVAVAYYLTSAVIALVFLRDRWLRAVTRWPKILLAAIVLTNGVLLSWSIFPLEKVERLWEQSSLKDVRFEPTDRFYYVSGRADTLQGKIEAFRRKWAMGPAMLSAKHPVGLLEPPGLNISGLKSFAPEAEGRWIYQAFNGDGVNRLVHLRLYYGGLLHVSHLLDMSAVKYYYSDKPLDDLPAQLVPFAQGKDLYVYKNTKAWDYYYLARKMVVYDSLEDIRRPVLGEVYIEGKDMFDASPALGSGRARLKVFEPGRMVFDVQTASEELLVVADAWHPFWKATLQGEDIPVLKVNGIFKGVRLKPGQYELTMRFDPSAYRLGIYVSMAAWILFIGVWLWAFRLKCLPSDKNHSRMK